MTRLFLDLDGTLVDPRQRLYGLFRELAPECTVSFDDYWRRKRAGAGQRQLLEELGYPPARIEAFRTAWMERIEEPGRLVTDLPFPDAEAFLDRMRTSFELVLVTARQHADRLADQIAGLGWTGRFAAVAATGQRQSKAELIRSHLAWAAGDLMVGDTAEDIQAGRELGLRTAAVTTGAMPEAALRACGPDLVAASLAALADLILPVPAEAAP